ncbi:hypothetical protein SPOG_05707, partial [Schizosaccharomyces cryophilus OY26]
LGTLLASLRISSFYIVLKVSRLRFSIPKPFVLTRFLCFFFVFIEFFFFLIEEIAAVLHIQLHHR